jgi:hypothetical protein
MVRWTNDEWEDVAAEYARQKGDPISRINKAQNIVFPPGSLRRRSIYQKQQFWEPLRRATQAIAIKAEEARQRAIIASTPAAAPTPVIATVAHKTVEVPEADSLDALVKRVVVAITKEVTGAVALAVIEEVKKAIAQEVPKAIQTSAAQWFADYNHSLEGEAQEPAPQEIHLTVAAAPPEGTTHLTLPAKDRKPRLTVMGLIGQQEQDVLHAWGQTIDFQFVKAGPQMGTLALEKSRTADVVINMTRFTSHTAEQYVKEITTPLVRINGSVSALKKWISDWVNGKMAIAG